jgi:archaellum component FlaC
MGTVLKVLVIVILVLSGAALFLAVDLYGKRELLINRTHLLEEQFRKVAKTIEAAEPQDAVQPNYVAKDVSPVTSKEMDNPERSPFWNTYLYKLETPNLPSMNLDSDKLQLQLRHYYQTTKDANGKDVKVKDPVNPGIYSTKGPGTMQELLDQVLERATKQNATLNKTRVELAKVREELGTTIEDYNKIKQDGRADKKTIDDKNKEIDKLKEDIRNLERKVSGLEEDKKNLTAEVAELKKDNENKQALVDDLTKQVKERDATIKKMMGDKGKAPNPTAPSEAFQGGPGDKGKIVAVDEKLKFVVVDLSDKAMTELVGEQRDRPMPQIELLVRRPGFKSAAGEFITRIKFRQVLRQKNLVVADILIDWQQAPVEVNDVVFF